MIDGDAGKGKKRSSYRLFVETSKKTTFIAIVIGSLVFLLWSAEFHGIHHPAAIILCTIVVLGLSICVLRIQKHPDFRDIWVGLVSSFIVIAPAGAFYLYQRADRTRELYVEQQKEKLKFDFDSLREDHDVFVKFSSVLPRAWYIQSVLTVRETWMRSVIAQQPSHPNSLNDEDGKPFPLPRYPDGRTVEQMAVANETLKEKFFSDEYWVGVCTRSRERFPKSKSVIDLLRDGMSYITSPDDAKAIVSWLDEIQAHAILNSRPNSHETMREQINELKQQVSLSAGDSEISSNRRVAQIQFIVECLHEICLDQMTEEMLRRKAKLFDDAGQVSN